MTRYEPPVEKPVEKLVKKLVKKLRRGDLARVDLCVDLTEVGAAPNPDVAEEEGE